MKRKEATERIRTRQLKKRQETIIWKDETTLKRDEKKHLRSAHPHLTSQGGDDSRHHRLIISWMTEDGFLSCLNKQQQVKPALSSIAM